MFKYYSPWGQENNSCEEKRQKFLLMNEFQNLLIMTNECEKNNFKLDDNVV